MTDSKYIQPLGVTQGMVGQFLIHLQAGRALTEGITQLSLVDGWIECNDNYRWDTRASVWRLWVKGEGWGKADNITAAVAEYIEALQIAVSTPPPYDKEFENSAHGLTNYSLWHIRNFQHGFNARYWRQWQNLSTYHGIIELAKAYLACDFNPMPERIGLPGCRFLDTTTGEIEEAERDDYILGSLGQGIGVGLAEEPDKEFGNFLWESLSHYSDLNDRFAVYNFLQEYAGAMLTGNVSNALMLFVWGPMGSGKNTFINPLQQILGEYAATVGGSRVAKEQSHSQWLAKLEGKRLVVINELPAGGRWQTESLNDFVAGDVVEANAMRQDSKNFRGVAHVIGTGNDRPTAQVDNGIWRRLCLIQFTNQPDTVDTHLQERFTKHLDGIFIWMLDGLSRFIDNGMVLDVPAIIRADTKDYQGESDPIGEYAKENLITVDGAQTSTQDLYQHFKTWYEENIGARVPTPRRFGARLDTLGYSKSVASNGRRFRQNVGIIGQ